MAIHRHKRLFYEFGPFRINSVERLLLRNGEAVPLTPKQFDILLVLVEYDGRVVEKEWLMQEIWPDTAVEEGNLTTNIYTLRKALGEGTNGQQYIQTLSRRGYRFVGEVREVVAGDARPAVKEPVELHLVTRQEQEAVLPGKALTRSGWAGLGAKWKLALAGVALLVVTVAVAFFWISGRPKPPASGGAVKTIAVLPFKPLSADSRNELLELGMADMLINKLSGIRQLIVRPMSSIRKYNSLDQDSIAAGRELGVDYVLEGNLQIEGEKTRATVRLLSVKDGSTVWSDKCDEQCSTIFELQDTIASQIARSLARELTGEEKKQLVKHYTESTDAHDAYLRGRIMLEKRTGPATYKSIEYLEQAVKLDPNFALAYANLSYAYWSLGTLDVNLPDEEVLPKAKEAVEKALEIDDTLAEAYTALGHVKMTERDLTGAESAYKRGIELNPNSGFVHSYYSYYLRSRGRIDEAVAESKLAVELEPTSVLYNRNVAMMLYYARRYDEAIDQSLKTLELDPNMITAYRWLARSYEQKKLYDQAVEAYLKTAEFGPEVEAGFREVYAASGWKGFWRKSLDLKMERAMRRGISLDALAVETYVRIGEKEQAFAVLEKAKRPLSADPFWDDLRSDPRYQDLVRRLGIEP